MGLGWNIHPKMLLECAKGIISGHVLETQK